MIGSLFARSGKYFSGLLVSRGVSLVVFVLFARALLPVSFGQFIFFITLVQIVTFFSDFGLNQWYQKKKGEAAEKNLFTEVFCARLTMLFLSVSLSYIFLIVFPQFSLNVSIIFLYTLIPEALLSIIDGFYLERGESLKLSMKNAVKMAVMLLGFILTKNSFTYETAVFLYFVGAAAAAVILFPVGEVLSRNRIYFSKIFTTLKSSSSYALLIFTSFFYARADHLMIKFMAGSAALGLYGGAYRYLESLSILPTALSHNLFPLSAKKSGITADELLKITITMIILGFIISLGTFFLSDFLIINILGQAYAPSVGVLKIFAGAVFLFFINAPLATVVQSSNLIKNFLPYGVANTLGNIILNLILIPQFGIYGAAAAMFTTEISGLGLNLFFIKRLYKNGK